MNTTGGIETVLAEHEAEWRGHMTPVGGGMGWICTCGYPTFGYDRARYRAHVAAAVRAHLLSDAVVERATHAYWNDRQGVALDAWLPPTDVNAMRAALAAAVGGDTE